MLFSVEVLNVSSCQCKKDKFSFNVNYSSAQSHLIYESYSLLIYPIILCLDFKWGDTVIRFMLRYYIIICVH